jgi:hypothetical protein
MKKTTIKTESVLNAYRVLSTAKYSKMDDADKIKVWKISRILKPIADKFDEDSKDAAERFKPSEDFDERLQKAQEYERLVKNKDADMTKLPIGAAEYAKFLEEFTAYQRLVGDAVKDFASKEVELEFNALTEDAFAKLMSSTEWNMEQVAMAGDIVCE